MHFIRLALTLLSDVINNWSSLNQDRPGPLRRLTRNPNLNLNLNPNLNPDPNPNLNPDPNPNLNPDSDSDPNPNPQRFPQWNTIKTFANLPMDLEKRRPTLLACGSHKR